MDYDALLFWCHLVLSFVRSTGRKGRNWIVVDVMLWCEVAERESSWNLFAIPGDDAKGPARDLDQLRTTFSGGKGLEEVVSV